MSGPSFTRASAEPAVILRAEGRKDPTSVVPSVGSLVAALLGMTPVVLLCAMAAVGPLACKKPDAAPPLKVAAASDLSFAFRDVGEAFEKKTGRKVIFSFGSTGLLAKQIAEGAPFDVFAAANVSYVDDVVKEGACLADSRSTYATGRIAVWSKKGTALVTIADLGRAQFGKIAIANPDHAPYGRAAKQALVKAGVWDSVASKIVYGENVQQALQFAQSGNADVAVIALSLATVTEGVFSPVDGALHEPLEQALVICHGAKELHGQGQIAGRAFTGFVNSDEGRVIMKRHGFLLPGESVTSAGAN